LKNIPFKYRFKYGWLQLLDKCLGRDKGVKLTKKSRVLLFKKLYTHLKKTGEGKEFDVERVSNISLKDFKKNYVAKGRPVVLEGLANDWDCVKNWSLDYFDKLHGDDEITIVANDLNETPFEILKLSEVLQDIKKGGSKYYRFYPLLKEHPEHIKDFDYTWLRKAKNRISFWEQFQVFIGGKGTSTPVHNAMASNIFVQAFGQKEWILYPPSMSIIIDPEPGINFHRGAPFKTTKGPFNPFIPDFDPPYTLYKYIDKIKVKLEPGDVFYNPPHYWHGVQNPTDSIGIGYRWLSIKSSFKSSPWYTFLDLIDAPFNKNIYLNMKKDYNLVHLKEMGTYKDYLKKKRI
jgi:hypothetical protein